MLLPMTEDRAEAGQLDRKLLAGWGRSNTRSWH
jgi:hypothetical protein